MVLPAFPVDPVSTNFSFAVGSDVVRTQLEGGAGRYRADYLGTTYLVKAEWIVNPSDYNLIETFRRTTIARGALPFTCNLLIEDNEIRAYNCYIVPDSWVLYQQSGEAFIIQATLEASPLL